MVTKTNSKLTRRVPNQSPHNVHREHDQDYQREYPHYGACPVNVRYELWVLVVHVDAVQDEAQPQQSVQEVHYQHEGVVDLAVVRDYVLEEFRQDVSTEGLHGDVYREEE